MPLTTETGREFEDADEALEFIRECHETMLDPNASMVKTSLATTEMVFTFRALDQHLRRGGRLPVSWTDRRQ